MTTTKRGKCPVCGYRWRLQKNGTLQSHWLYRNTESRYCDGSYQLPAPEPKEKP